MRQKEFKAVFDGEKYVLPQELKYRIKNRISEITATAKPFVKRSVSAMASIILASVLVVTAAAVGGIALFKSIYGENIEPIMPYSEIINTKASDENYELTLHEAVADEYTTAYIFSVKRLTVGVSKAIDNGSTMIFKSFAQVNLNADRFLEYYNSQDNPEYFTTFNGYSTFENQIFAYQQLVLIRPNAAFKEENDAKYLIHAIDNLKTEDTDYYALYVINGENQTLNIGIGTCGSWYGNFSGGPELTLPKMTQKAPSVTRSVQEYYRQYLKQTHPTMLFNGTRLADTVTITPLAVYVKSTGALSSSGMQRAGFMDYINGSLYRSAELVFGDGTEKTLTEMSQDEMGIRISANTGIYLFNEVMDTSQVKSFMVYDTVEFPMDVNLPVIDRETGTEIVPKYEVFDLVFDLGNELVTYLDGMYPEERKEGYKYCGSPRYESENSCTINGHDCMITLTGYELNGETFSAAADRMLQEYFMKYNWAVSNTTIKDGTCSLGNVRYADITASILGGAMTHTHYFFFETGGKLIVLQLNENTNAWPYYSLDALLQLITFK